MNFYCGTSFFNCPIAISAGKTITWSNGGYGGSIIADLVQNVGGYISLNALQGSTYEVLRAQYVNGVGPSCSFSSPVYVPSLTIAGATPATQTWVTSQNYLSNATVGTITNYTLGGNYTYYYNTAYGFVGLYFPAAGSYVITGNLEITFSTGGTLNYIDFYLTFNSNYTCDSQFGIHCLSIYSPCTAGTYNYQVTQTVRVSGPVEITVCGKISHTPGTGYTYQVLAPSGINCMRIA